MTIKETYQKVVESMTFSRDPDLVGKPIRVTHAGEKYGIAYSTLQGWAMAGMVRITNQAPKLLELDEADVKLAAQIYNTAKKHTTPHKAAWVLKRAFENN